MKIKSAIKKNIPWPGSNLDPCRHEESTLPTAPLKRTIQVLHKERISSPDLNLKETADVTTMYWREQISKTFNFPPSRVAPSFISKTVPFILFQ